MKVTIHVLLAYNRESTTSTVCSWCGGYGDVVPLDAVTAASRAGLMVDGVRNEIVIFNRDRDSVNMRSLCWMVLNVKIK